jgi:hypothetical protein
VLLIGDSYVNLNAKAFGKELNRLARADGSLGVSDEYADRSVSGTQMVGGFFHPNIPMQYAAENNGDGHVKTVVMDGGGNDLLIGDRPCLTMQSPPESQHCVATIEGVAAGATALFTQMASDGVEHVVFFSYPHLPGGGNGGPKEIENATLDYFIPAMKEVCDTAPLDCVFIDTRGLFGDAVTDFQDGIHPIIDNTNKISAAVWAAMTTKCIAQ